MSLNAAEEQKANSRHSPAVLSKTTALEVIASSLRRSQSRAPTSRGAAGTVCQRGTAIRYAELYQSILGSEWDLLVSVGVAVPTLVLFWVNG